jgi:hypothetical protein
MAGKEGEWPAWFKALKEALKNEQEKRTRGVENDQAIKK